MFEFAELLFENIYLEGHNNSSKGLAVSCGCTMFYLCRTTPQSFPEHVITCMRPSYLGKQALLLASLVPMDPASDPQHTSLPGHGDRLATNMYSFLPCIWSLASVCNKPADWLHPPSLTHTVAATPSCCGAIDFCFIRRNLSSL